MNRVLHGFELAGLVWLLALVLHCAFRTGGFRARFDCRLDVSGEIARKLHARRLADGVYPAPGGAAPYYGPLLASDFPELARLEVHRDVHEAGRSIHYRGGALDPFRRTPIFPAERLLRGRYRHSASAEGFGGVVVKGYPFRYYRSRSGEWALLLSNGPDGDADLGREKLEAIDQECATLEQLIETLSPMGGMMDGDYSEVPGASDGDLATLLHEDIVRLYGLVGRPGER